MRRLIVPVVLATALAALAAVWLVHRHHGGEPAVSSSSSSSQPGSVSSAGVPASSEVSGVGGFTAPSGTGAADPASGPTWVVEQVEPAGTPVDPTAAAIPRDQQQAARFAAYARAATAFMLVFARPPATVSPADWWARVRLHLSDSAANAYAGTDPRNVPFTRVTGPAVILPTTAPADLLTLARVPTDAGYYRVEMETDEQGIHITRAVPESAP